MTVIGGNHLAYSLIKITKPWKATLNEIKNVLGPGYGTFLVRGADNRIEGIQLPQATPSRHGYGRVAKENEYVIILRTPSTWVIEVVDALALNA